MDTLEFVYEPWKYPDDDYPYPGDWDYEMDIDDGGCGWYESGPGDNKCVLDKGIATLLVSLGYVVPTKRKTVAFFLECMSDPVIQDLPFEERVVLVYKEFGLGDDEDAICGYGWWDPDDWDGYWTLVHDKLASSFALSSVPASPVPPPVPAPAPLASAPPPAVAFAAAVGSAPASAPPAAVGACAAAALAPAAVSAAASASASAPAPAPYSTSAPAAAASS